MNFFQMFLWIVQDHITSLLLVVSLIFKIDSCRALVRWMLRLIHLVFFYRWWSWHHIYCLARGWLVLLCWLVFLSCYFFPLVIHVENIFRLSKSQNIFWKVYNFLFSCTYCLGWFPDLALHHRLCTLPVANGDQSAWVKTNTLRLFFKKVSYG